MRIKAIIRITTAVLAFLTLRASAGESASHVIYIQVIRPNIASIQQDMGSSSGQSGSGVVRYRLNWNLGSTSRKLTVSSNRTGARIPIAYRTAAESEISTRKPLILSDVERDVIPAFIKTSGSMQVEHGYLPTITHRENGMNKPMVTYTVTDI